MSAEIAGDPAEPKVGPESAAAPSAAFTDADGAARWVDELPATNVIRTYEVVLEQLTALAAMALPPRERARIAEVLRGPVARLHTELARRYAGKPQPAPQRELEALEQAIALWHALWQQYSACLKPLLEGDPELAPVKAKIVQRGLYV